MPQRNNERENIISSDLKPHFYLTQCPSQIMMSSFTPKSPLQRGEAECGHSYSDQPGMRGKALQYDVRPFSWMSTAAAAAFLNTRSKGTK